MDTNNFGADPGLDAPITTEPSTAIALANEIPANLLARDEKGKEYIVIDSTKLAASGAEAITPERLKLPTLKLLNATSGEVSSGNVIGARAGVYYNDLTAELHEEVHFIPLHSVVRRYMYAPGSLSEMLCFSPDGLGEYGSPKKTNEELAMFKPPLAPIPLVNIEIDGKDKTVGQCVKCPHSQFGEDNQKPNCRKVSWVYGIHLSALAGENLDQLEYALTHPSDLGEILGLCFGIPFSGAGGEECKNKIANAAYFSGGVYTQGYRLAAELKSSNKTANRWWSPIISPIAKLDARQKRAANSLRMIVRKINPILWVDDTTTASATPAPIEDGADIVDVD